ncbi:MAG: hypothetical protein IID16_09750 [Candidatus Marinimicrobia bacterium]|nr:hypothetical protein [Candidatus Neomarinimicrobiota bacterium]
MQEKKSRRNWISSDLIEPDVVNIFFFLIAIFVKILAVNSVICSGYNSLLDNLNSLIYTKEFIYTGRKYE